MVINNYIESCFSFPNGSMKISRDGDYVWTQSYGLQRTKNVLVTTEILLTTKSAAIRDLPRAHSWHYYHMDLVQIDYFEHLPLWIRQYFVLNT